MNPATDPSQLPSRRHLLRRFQAAFGSEAAFVVRAPGRVNLIGEHTDYNEGFVLPCAIDRDTLVAVRPRSDRRVRVLAVDLGNLVDEFELDAVRGGPQAGQAQAGHWADYVRGMAWALQADGLALQGADLAITGNVPRGAGLSSSASLEVAVGQAFKQLGGLAGLDATRLALQAQRAENDYVGCRCGIMDQFISAHGQAGHALLIDCRDLSTRQVPLPPGVAVLIVHSRVRRGLVDSAYNERRAQCEAAARHFGLASLRELDLARLESAGPALDPLVRRRARHVVSENARTLAAAEALAAGDLARMGVLMAQSHASMRDDFEITVPAIDRLVEILAQAIGTEGGARMTGGGFGGCVVALLPAAQVAQASEAVRRHYRSPEGEAAQIHLCHASPGAGLG